MKAISQLYQKETGKELKVKEGVAIEEAINQNCQKLAELTETKNSLIQILEESKNLNVYTQKQMEIMA